VFDAKLVEFELTLSDPVHEFDAGDGRRGSSKMLEAEHRTKPQLDRSMVLFNQIVDVFGRPDLALISLGMFAESLCRPAMRRLIAVERDLVWQLALALERPSEERLGGGDVPLGAKQEIDGLSLFVDSAVKIRPAASDFDVGLIDASGPPSWASKAVPAFLEFGSIALDLTHDRRVRQGEPAFGHHLDEITKAELVAQIPPHTEDDDLPIEVAAFEEFVHAQHASQLHQELRGREICPASDLCTTTVGVTGAHRRKIESDRAAQLPGIDDVVELVRFREPDRRKS